jgi:hypothetical protein
MQLKDLDGTLDYAKVVLTSIRESATIGSAFAKTRDHRFVTRYVQAAIVYRLACAVEGKTAAPCGDLACAKEVVHAHTWL